MAAAIIRPYPGAGRRRGTRLRHGVGSVPPGRDSACCGLALHLPRPTGHSVAHLSPAKLPAAQCLLTWTLLAAPAAPVCAASSETGLSWGGNLAVTSDYIYRGVSESDGQGALQADLHAETQDGTFAGLWASTRDRSLEPGAGGDLEVYLGHRFELSGAWSASLSARSHYLLGGGAGEPSDDYQELAASLTWLDRWSVSVTAIPSAVRYWYYQRQPRSPAWVADSAGQWLLGSGLFVTAGVGYYRSTGTGPGRFAAT